VQDLAAAVSPAWAVFALVPLAIAGCEIDLGRLARGLRDLKRHFVLDAEALGHSSTDAALGSYVIDTVLSGAEILAADGRALDTVRNLIAPFLDAEVRRVDRRHDFETDHLDAILRSYCLSETLEGREVKAEDVLTARPEPPADPEKQKRPQREGRDHDGPLRELIRAISGFYAARARAIASTSRSTASFQADLSGALEQLARESWRFDRHHTSSAIRAKIAESLAVLIAVGMDGDLLLTRALEIRQGFWPSGASGVGRLFTRFSAIPTLHPRLLTEISKAVDEARRERTGAEDKSRTLASYAKLLVPISSEDADVAFKDAIEVASELDSEAVDQLKFASCLIERAVAEPTRDAPSMAQSFAEVIQDAGIRLQNVEHFPWDCAFRGLALLNFPTALAAAARWDDTNTVELHRSLAPAVAVGVAAGSVTPEQALAMLQLLDRAEDEDLQFVLREGNSTRSVAEELAHDLLCDRMAPSDTIAEFVVRFGNGAWARYFRSQQEFERALPPGSATTPDNAARKDVRSRSVLETHVWNDAVVIEPQRLAETTAELVKRSRAAGEYLSMEEVLRHARSKLTIGNRIAHLEALASLLPSVSSRDVVQAILGATEEWSEQPAVIEWCKSRMPELIASNLPGFSEYHSLRQGPLQSALLKTRASDTEVQGLLLDGIARNADSLSASMTFSLAGEIASRLPPAQATALCKWYIARLSARIHPDDLERIPAESTPTDAEEAVARFLFAYLGEVDVRKRWRAAHALRRLARLGADSTLAKVIDEQDRHRDLAFRDPTAPYYWLASKLWLVIALDRIAIETPAAAARHGDWLLAVALSEEFPHLLLRDYAADACRTLIASGHLIPPMERGADLKSVNHTHLPIGRKKHSWGTSFGGFGGRSDDEKRRFHFDRMDTLRYWYEPWLRVFQDLTPDTFLEAAECWIVDKWGTQDERPYGSKEPRSHRFTEHNSMLSHASHGALPTLESHRTYLEWHAMWCAAGDILRTHRVARREYRDDDGLRYQISYNKLSTPGMWAADLVSPQPLELQLWCMSQLRPEWFDDVPDDRFLAEAMPTSHPEYIVVDAYIETTWKRRQETTRVKSNLVSTETAQALVRALQTIEDNHDYYFYPEGHEAEIDDLGYVLKGWLKHHDGDPGPDKRDVFSNGLTRLETEPGARVTARFNLDRRLGAGSVQWIRPGETDPSFIYEAWGPRERDEPQGYYGDEVRSTGERLLMRADHLAQFLTSEGFHLITKVGVTRSDNRERSYHYDEEEESQVAEFDRVFLLKADGTLEAAERGFGSWRKDSSGTAA
jgi:hypothetical protein